jgi:hypothetical protein
MEKETKTIPRNKFLLWGIGLTSLFTLPGFFRSAKTKKPIQTAKMLTQDGRLVEVDISGITGRKEKIKNEDIHTWVKKSGSL